MPIIANFYETEAKNNNLRKSPLLTCDLYSMCTYTKENKSGH